MVIGAALSCLNDVRNDLVERGIGESCNFSSEGTEYVRGDGFVFYLGNGKAKILALPFLEVCFR